MKKFFYYHSPKAKVVKGEPVAKAKRFTVAGVLEDKRISLAASACSKNDQFNKKIGRSIALGRALVMPHSTTAIELSANPGLAFKQLAEILIRDLTNETLMVRKGKIEPTKKPIVVNMVVTN